MCIAETRFLWAIVEFVREASLVQCNEMNDTAHLSRWSHCRQGPHWAVLLLQH